MSVNFKPDAVPGSILHEWWARLQKNRGARAELRRCRTPAKVMLHPVYCSLYTRFKPMMGDESGWEERLAAIAGLLAHVEHESDVGLALQMAGKPKPEISELRFRRLLQYERASLYVPMVRVLRKLNKTANIYDLAASVFYWGDDVRKRWALDYFPNTPDQQSS